MSHVFNRATTAVDAVQLVQRGIGFVDGAVRKTGVLASKGHGVTKGMVSKSNKRKAKRLSLAGLGAEVDLLV